MRYSTLPGSWGRKQERIELSMNLGWCLLISLYHFSHQTLNISMIGTQKSSQALCYLVFVSLFLRHPSAGCTLAYTGGGRGREKFSGIIKGVLMNLKGPA